MAAEIGETNFELPGQIEDVYRGKVGEAYSLDHAIGNLLVVVRSDRISAFDVVLPQLIPQKGHVLNGMSTELLRGTSAVAPNWWLDSPDPNVSIGYRAEPIKVEMIVRGAMLGSLWKAYNEQGVRDICGNPLADGLNEFRPFDVPLLTPTTKADEGHDENITPAEIVETGLASDDDYQKMARLSMALFLRGQEMADSRGLFLADTKYEFGRLATGGLVVIDEVHTPDSSRYFYSDQYRAYLTGETEARPEQLSKEFVREWLKSQGFEGQAGQTPPTMPQTFIDQVTRQYVRLYEQMLGHKFNPDLAANRPQRLNDMETRIRDALRSLGSRR